jgi:hypothetical protein
MVSGQMTRGAAISMALLAIIVLALIVLLAWPTHSASDSPVGTDDLTGHGRSSSLASQYPGYDMPARLDADRAAPRGR